MISYKKDSTTVGLESNEQSPACLAGATGVAKTSVGFVVWMTAGGWDGFVTTTLVAALAAAGVDVDDGAGVETSSEMSGSTSTKKSHLNTHRSNHSVQLIKT